MRQRYGIWAAAILVLVGSLGKGLAQAENGPRDGVRLPVLGPDRETIDLLRTRPEEVERRMRERESPDPGLTALSPLPVPDELSAEEPAPEAAAEVVDVDRIRVSASAPGEGVVQGEVALTNTADQSHRLVRVFTEAAEEALLHTVERRGGVAQVQRLGGLLLPPEEQVELRPGGPRLLLVDLRRPLSQGEAITLELYFDDGSRKRVEAPVQQPVPGR
ncbi:copper chaperone PCu(A)C [Halorhodospira halophila]|uniref:Copper chaperone PCu(A)C n=1 Tax=Halorhodospira halophila (strain DSM 244 / SL1) TaxID=349124 RepID=A1WTF6_HALHL|nr:copper chaperone PCu(A)C [Halorhodospira halophila]ABM60968.1 protein of unknown function DUF461 [Halorhodospira halophila SL1]MBK1728626.1 copper chaperone PCu(A)C [Halorhodospira halophila]